MPRSEFVGRRSVPRWLWRSDLGISGSASLSTYPVVLNVSGQATLLICNRSNSAFNTTSTVTLDYRLT